MPNSETWSREFPRVSGFYWMRGFRQYRALPVEVNGSKFGMMYMMYGYGVLFDSKDAADAEFLGPISPSDAQQLSELRSEALKGICVYCGEVQQYESMEQKSGEEGNRIRVEHIRQCSQRPELKLIAYCEQLQDAANAAFRCLCGTGDKSIEQVKDQLRAALFPDHQKEASPTKTNEGEHYE